MKTKTKTNASMIPNILFSHSSHSCGATSPLCVTCILLTAHHRGHSIHRSRTSIQTAIALPLDLSRPSHSCVGGTVIVVYDTHSFHSASSRLLHLLVTHLDSDRDRRTAKRDERNTVPHGHQAAGRAGTRMRTELDVTGRWWYCATDYNTMPLFSGTRMEIDPY